MNPSPAPIDPVPGPEAVVAVTASADETRRLAGALAPLCVPGDVVLLAGDLGAGKTTFAQGFGAALGVTEPITSPTFVLVHQYPLDGAGPVRVLLHADVYRLDRLHEIVELGLGELVEDGGVALVEWGDAAEPVLGSGALTIRLGPADGSDDDDDDGDDEDKDDGDVDSGDEHRVITVSGVDDAWAGRWDGLAHALGPWRVAR